MRLCHLKATIGRENVNKFTLDKSTKLWYIILMNDNKLNPLTMNWMTHAEHEARRDKLTRWTNPTLWALLTQHGAAKPEHTDSWWNDWAANNPQPEAHALGGFDFVKPMMASLTGIVRGARPIEKD